MERQSMSILLRIVAGLLFVQTGGLILFGWFGGIPRQPGTPPLMWSLDALIRRKRCRDALY
jgi:hypothetical protein